ncbi:DUF3099 domain-containing protein [Agromyces salentinus]|uniref:DUF3099 domain-containing protein n=1 Tax=Agromyces salentinus TaxID=269421 RepID=A0ABN2MYX1_9MICO|nr:DUF3099 domain-containing protein [Agromyces salentinus]
MKQQSITSLPPSPEAEQRSRMIKYSIAMGVRLVCIVAMLFARDWWLVVCAVGAIALPYFAVVIANVGSPARIPAVERPGGILPVRPGADAAGPGAGSAAGSDERAGEAGHAASDPPRNDRDEDGR